MSVGCSVPRSTQNLAEATLPIFVIPEDGSEFSLWLLNRLGFADRFADVAAPIFLLRICKVSLVWGREIATLEECCIETDREGQNDGDRKR
jgi:hypothetical protein